MIKIRLLKAAVAILISDKTQYFKIRFLICILINITKVLIKLNLTKTIKKLEFNLLKIIKKCLIGYAQKTITFSKSSNVGIIFVENRI